MKIDHRDILRFFEQSAKRPLNARDIMRQLDLSGRERRNLLRLLEDLVQQGSLVELRGNRYALPQKVSLVTGTLSVNRGGFGFVRPFEEGAEDVFVPARFLREAMHGDQVSVRVQRSQRDGRPEGRIVQVLEHAQREVLGRFEEGHRFGYVVPEDPRLLHDIYIQQGATGGACHGQMVLARIDSYPGKARGAEGVVLEVLGDPDDPEVEQKGVIYRHGLPDRFLPETLAEAEQVPAEVDADELSGRTDLLEFTTMTIDGETARDFDDAVSVHREDSGCIRLWVSIADVAHYVTEGSALDKEAIERGTSVYFPGRCLPMLPERLSNGICSLNPQVDRLAMTAEMLFDGEGHRVESRFYPSIIRSDARLTYGEVRDMVEDKDPGTIGRYPEIYPHLQVMDELAGRLTAMRRKRGSLDFDLPEAQIVLDLTGKPEDIIRGERTMAHRLIEEFMLAANEAVADFLTRQQLPLLYRVHEPPDLAKMQAFQEFIAHFNYGFNLGEAGVRPGQLQQLLAGVEGKPEEKLVNQVLLRSMKQAHYTPDNAGHFGLAAELYCHFTSPIRRYPDLVVHRALKAALAAGGPAKAAVKSMEKALPAMGEHCSARERRAMEAERELVELKKCRYMLDHVGGTFDGLVSGVTAFGFFVELIDVFVEGLVHISSLGDDFYHYEESLHRLVGENRRRIFQVGERVQIVVKDVNLPRREIDFVLADLEKTRSPKRSRRRRGGRP